MYLQKVISKNTRLFFVRALRSLTKRTGPRDGSGSVSQRYGYTDPDPYQNVTDPNHWSADRHIDS